MKNKGFTLIELLVVVLIIGILASIALPQYRTAVEKSKSAEALMNIGMMKKQIEFYIMANGLPDNGVFLDDVANVELSGGEWDEDHNYTTQNFVYGPSINGGGGSMEIYRINDSYAILCTQYETGYNSDTTTNDGWYCTCITQLSDSGRKICKSIYEPLGFKYVDNEL